MPSDAWTLSATCRCLHEDLRFSTDDCERPLRDLDSHPVVGSFIERRSITPVGQETIQELAPLLIAFSLHVGRYRAATWHHEALGVVWLLAAAIHRDASPRDAYHYFAQLQRAGRILPTRHDIQRVVHERATSFAHSLLEDVPRIRHEAQLRSNTVYEATIGGRVRVRLFYEPGDPAFLTVAISGRLVPGSIVLPPQWETQILAAFFPGSAFESLCYTDMIGAHPVAPDEHAYYDAV